MNRVELIAECSSNHGGQMGLAKEFIWRFAEAGADWVKFQHTRVKHLRPDDPQYAWFQQAEFSVEQFAELKAECERAGTKFLTTVYNHQDVPEVVSLGLEAIKIGSGEANENWLLDVVQRWPRVFMSLGLHRGRPWMAAFDNVEYFYCVTRYPCQPASANREYDETFRGWSDHAVGLDGCRIAIERGARIIEKHVQLPNQARPPKCFEATVEEFKQLRQFADEDPARFLGRWQYA